MNRFLTHTGRQPIWLDDLNFIQDSFADEIKKLVQGLVGMTNDPVILTGCEVTQNEDGTYTVSEGVIYLNGEILRLPEGVYAKIDTLRIREDVSYDSNGDRILQDSGDEVNCYKCKKAILGLPINSTGKPDPAPTFIGCIKYADIIKNIGREVILYEHDYPAPAAAEDHYFKLYKKNGSYYLDFSFRATYSALKTSLMQSSVYLNDEDDMEALGFPEGAASEKTFWKYGRTYCSCIGFGSGYTVPIGIMIRTSRISDMKIKLALNLYPYGNSSIGEDIEIRGGFHTKLNTL